MKNERGQGVVEFTLIIVMLLVIAWIPADFGLGIYSGQVAQNAAREGARIAAATPALTAQVPAGTTVSCTWPCSGQGELLQGMAKRTSSVLMKDATISLSLQAGASCERLITARVSGNYNFFFFQLLRLMNSNAGGPVNIVRQSQMRWEHAC